MNFQINHMLIENFRSIEKLETDLWDKTVISGANECNKTSVLSAISWALTGKTIENESSFEIIPYGKSGIVSPSVKIECKIGDRPATIQRVCKAMKLRDNTFDKYVTVMLVNGLEVGVKKFQQWISENICDESIFRILCNPTTFITDCPKETKELQWQSQRRFLMNLMGGEQTDIEIAKSSNKWLDIVDGIERFGDATQYLQCVKKEFQKTQKLLDEYNIRIDQSEKSLREVSHTKDELEKMQERLLQEKDELIRRNEQYKSECKNETAEKKKAELEKVSAEKKAVEDSYAKELEMYRRKRSELENTLTKEKERLNGLIEKLQLYIKTLDMLKAKEVKSVCEYCGSALNPEMVEKQKEEIQQRIKNGTQKTKDLRKEVANCKKKCTDLADEIKRLMEPTYPAKIESLKKEEQDMMMDIILLDSETDMPNFTADCKHLDDLLEQAKQEMFVCGMNQKTQDEISRIESEQNETLKELSELQRRLDTTKEFVSEKCRSAESKINGLFEHITVQLFEQNKTNDDAREVCNILFNGHKYQDLSASTKIFAGLEIIKAFQKAYGIATPVFIDNMESITGEIDMDCQTIIAKVKDEPCPKCGSFNHSRRTKNGLWKCFDCGNEFEKHLHISIEGET